MVKRKAVRVGERSIAIVIPPALAELCGIKPRTEVEIDVDVEKDKKILIIRPTQQEVPG